MPDSATYRIEAPDEYFEALVALQDGHQRRVTGFLRDHLLHTPTDPHPGLKQLRGQHKGIWQYMVSDAEGIRLHYTVDEDARVVHIERLGRHPDWSRARDRQRLD